MNSFDAVIIVWGEASETLPHTCHEPMYVEPLSSSCSKFRVQSKVSKAMQGTGLLCDRQAHTRCSRSQYMARESTSSGAKNSLLARMPLSGMPP